MVIIYIEVIYGINNKLNNSERYKSKKLIYDLVLAGRIIDVGERFITRTTRNYRSGKPRFIINLPTHRNNLWELL